MVPSCIKCSREAEYDSPEDFCQFHGLEWLYEGWEQNFQASEFQSDFKDEDRHIRPLLQLIKHDNPEDHALMGHLAEQYFQWLKKDDDDES